MATVKTVYEDVYVYPCNVPNTAIVDGEFPASGSYIDVGDFEHCAFIIVAGDLDSALTCQVQQAATSTGTAKDLTGAQWVIGTNDDGKVGVIEFKPAALDINNGYNYVTLDITGASGNDYAAVTFLGFAKGKPVTQSSTYFDTSAIVNA